MPHPGDQVMCAACGYAEAVHASGESVPRDVCGEYRPPPKGMVGPFAPPPRELEEDTIERLQARVDDYIRANETLRECLAGAERERDEAQGSSRSFAAAYDRAVEEKHVLIDEIGNLRAILEDRDADKRLATAQAQEIARLRASIAASDVVPAGTVAKLTDDVEKLRAAMSRLTSGEPDPLAIENAQLRAELAEAKRHVGGCRAVLRECDEHIRHLTSDVIEGETTFVVTHIAEALDETANAEQRHGKG